VLTSAGDADRIARLVFANTSTIGVRITSVRRLTLLRDEAELETPWGPVRAKRIERPGAVEITPEADACAELAAQAGVSVRDVMAAARAAAIAGITADRGNG
jgi:uncharacterized protein (DUF111 family)